MIELDKIKDILNQTYRSKYRRYSELERELKILKEEIEEINKVRNEIDNFLEENSESLLETALDLSLIEEFGANKMYEEVKKTTFSYNKFK